jgi:hypothetical protein
LASISVRPYIAVLMGVVARGAMQQNVGLFADAGGGVEAGAYSFTFQLNLSRV